MADPPVGRPVEVIDEACPPKSTDDVPACEFSKLIVKPTAGVTGFEPPLGVELLGVGDGVLAGLLGAVDALGEADGTEAESFNTVHRRLLLSPVNHTQRLVPVPPS